VAVRHTRLAIRVFVLGLVFASGACNAPATPSAEPMSELCSSMRSLSAWISEGHVVLDATRAGDGPAAQESVDAAWIHYQDARAKNGHSGWLADQAGSPPPEWRPLHEELGALIADAEPTMLALANANREVEPVGRMLAAIEARANAIALPEECRIPALLPAQ
jgi:hypothetical protein